MDWAEERRGSFALSRWVFLRLLALVYAVAFLSLAPQIAALVGGRGLEPAAQELAAARSAFGAARFWLEPTLCWIGASDGFLEGLCWVGAALSLVLFLDVAPAWSALALYVLYLSIATVGGDFLGFQWDVLLLETGLLATMLAPWRLRPGLARDGEPLAAARWLVWWLVFRLMFASGVVKFASGDPTWSELRALEFHYQTQPLPTTLAWYAHQLPAWIHKLSAGWMFGVELGASLLVFAPRLFRHAGAWLLLSLQALIALTGNYGFFNLVSVALCLFLFDDAALARAVPTRWRAKLAEPRAASVPRLQRAATAVLAVVVVAVSGIQTTNLLLDAVGRPGLGREARELVALARPLRSINTYGLFAVMTTERPEIVLEGSADGLAWKSYEFRWKPGDLARAPGWVAPHMPRLDWQMWFAALGGARQERWLRVLVQRLLEGEPRVLALFAFDPFPGAPPKYVRAFVDRYEFTTRGERAATGHWWKRERLGLLLPATSLK